jgi:hypothetical protein
MKYYYDEQRHLVCVPYSVENLHVMAADLGIKRCWYHAGDKPHYDVPKRMMSKIGEVATLVSPREILKIVNGNGN